MTKNDLYGSVTSRAWENGSCSIDMCCGTRSPGQKGCFRRRMRDTSPIGARICPGGSSRRTGLRGRSHKTYIGHRLVQTLPFLLRQESQACLVPVLGLSRKVQSRNRSALRIRGVSSASTWGLGLAQKRGAEQHQTHPPTETVPGRQEIPPQGSQSAQFSRYASWRTPRGRSTRRLTTIGSA